MAVEERRRSRRMPVEYGYSETVPNRGEHGRMKSGGDAFRQVMEETLAWYGTHLPAR
jgi:hypothetical protein